MPAVGRLPRHLLERGAAAVEVDLVPDRMVVRHRLAPVSHGKARLDLLRRAEFLRRIFELEAVEKQRPPQEALLRLRRARSRPTWIRIHFGFWFRVR